MRILGLTAGLLLFGTVSCAAADREFDVNTTDDLHDLDPGDGICAANLAGDQCSLRAALEEARLVIDSLGVLIRVPSGTYALTLGQLELDRGGVTVRGVGPGNTVVDGSSSSRIVALSGDARLILFEGLTLRNGRTSSPNSGGGVYIDSQNALVTFSSVTIEDNVANFRGGGIYAIGRGVVNVINSTVQRNNSTDMGPDCNIGGGQSGGGGIYASGPSLTVAQSEIRDNCGSNGGGISLGSGRHLILRSTVAGNRSGTTGPGVYLHASRARIEDSTIAGNVVTAPEAPTGTAAGIHVLDSELTILSSTIVGNQNQFEGAEGAGGILNDEGDVTMRNTVLAENHFFGLRECRGSIDSQGGNFIGTTTDCDIDAAASDQLDADDPGLGALTSNGGRTRTMMPTARSPLVDTGIDGCGPIDQRGLAFQAPKGNVCDIGAVER
jgi:parallel beta helix pectate lyase-like protein